MPISKSRAAHWKSHLTQPARAGLILLSAAFVLSIFGPAACAENIIYPTDSGVLNAKSAPYNAAGNGRTDDTAAIQSALVSS